MRSVRCRGYVCAAVIETATVFDWAYHAFRWTWHDPDGYNFISGPLADITLVGGVYAIFRRHNCHARHCWRIGRHKVPGTDFIVCRKHHPRTITPTAEQILAVHQAAVERGADPPNSSSEPPAPAAPPGPPETAGAT